MNNTNKAFGRLLRVLREEAGLSQVDFARRAKWPQTTVSRVEQGRRHVTLPELFDTARALRCSVEDLLARLRAPSPEAQPESAPVRRSDFTPGFAAAFASEEASLAQLARYGVRFLGGAARPALLNLPLEEVLLAALRHGTDPRVFETLPALLLGNAPQLDWSKLVAGAYELRLQNRLGMAVSAALELKGSAKAAPEVWPALEAARAQLADSKLDREETLGPPPRTAEARAHLKARTPQWLSFWHGLGSADLESFRRHLPQ